jgi:hypothetical protein
MEAGVGEARKSERREACLFDTDPELLFEFADEGLLRPLIHLDFAAGKFPKTGKNVSIRALRDQHAAIPVDQGGGGNEREFHER